MSFSSRQGRPQCQERRADNGAELQRIGGKKPLVEVVDEQLKSMQRRPPHGTSHGLTYDKTITLCSIDPYNDSSEGAKCGTARHSYAHAGGAILKRNYNPVYGISAAGHRSQFRGNRMDAAQSMSGNSVSRSLKPVRIGASEHIASTPDSLSSRLLTAAKTAL